GLGLIVNRNLIELLPKPKGEGMKIDWVFVFVPSITLFRLVAGGSGHVPAGFPSPAQDYSATQIDLTKLLIKDELSTFIVRVSGDSMMDTGVSDGDELIVDRGIEPATSTWLSPL